MDGIPNTPIPKPANLPRRMMQSGFSDTVVLSRNETAPALRVPIETGGGNVVVRLEGAAGQDTQFQWFRNTEPLVGETGPAIYFSQVDCEDSDLYFATITSGQTVQRSQSLVLTVYPSNPLLNLSSRAFVTPTSPLVVGFVIGGGRVIARNKTYLIRVINASLSRFGVTNPARRPAVQLTRRTSGGMEPHALCSTPDDPKLRKIAQRVGAFALPRDATDFAALAVLAPGVYTLAVSVETENAGEVLAELYETSE